VSAPQASGRWASNEPASANLAKAHRAVYVADPGHVTITCDLSQVDVRALAGHSQDPALIAMLQPGMDYHCEMAEMMCGDRTRRKEYKNVSHGLNYNQSPRTVAEQHGLDVAATYRAKERHAERLHVFEEWKQRAVEHASTGALLDNGFGRMMRCDPERAWTQAPALYGQGGARDIMTESMLRFVDRAEESNGMGRQARDAMRGVVHDELVISVPEEEAEYWQRLLKEAFTWEWRGVPILAEVSNPAYRWSDCAH
jgi:DNA polymerase-1